LTAGLAAGQEPAPGPVLVMPGVHGQTIRPAARRAAAKEDTVVTVTMAQEPAPSLGVPERLRPPQLVPGTAAPAVTPAPVTTMDPGFVTSFGGGGGGSPYFRAEYLAWWIKDYALPALVTTSTTQEAVGRLGFPDTKVLYGGEVDGDVRHGTRLTLGWGAGGDDDGGYGVEGVYFVLGRHSNPFSASSAGDPVLARPFFDVNAGVQRVEQVANVRLTDAMGNTVVRASAGTIGVANPSRIWGAELLATSPAGWGFGGQRFQLLAGYRHLSWYEGLAVREDLVRPADPQAGGEVRFLVNDAFATRNQFHGAELALRTGWAAGPWSLEATGKVALGVVRQTVSITGFTLTTPTGGVADLQPGGLLALGSNIGHYEHTRFAVLPELTLNLGYQVTEGLRGFIGYNFLYLSSVVRPGDQVDTNLNLNLLPPQAPPPIGVLRPAFPFKDRDTWIQGAQAGVEWRF
jgi:hypothetical protein